MTISRLLLVSALVVLSPACSDPSASDGNPDMSAFPGDGGQAACSAAAITYRHGNESPQQPIVHVLSKAKYPLALCNDGTPGAYVFRPGVGGGAKRWIIYLEGGGLCGDAASCKLRYDTTPFYMTSSGTTDGQVYPTLLEGLKSTDMAVNPDFRDANLVQLYYCSSDTWSGDRAGDGALPTDNLGRWHFRGRSIISAVLAELLPQGLATAEEVLLTGSSAGAIGVVSNADDVRQALPAAVRYVAMMDAGFFINYPDFDSKTNLESTAMPTMRELELTSAVAAWGGRGDASCEAAATDSAAHTRCRSVYDVLRAGYVQTPLFIRQSVYDMVQLKMLVPVPPQDAAGKAALKAYGLRFAQTLVQDLKSLSGISVFATNDTRHGVINSTSEWSTTTVDTLLLPAVFGAWYANPCAAPVTHIATP